MTETALLIKEARSQRRSLAFNLSYLHYSYDAEHRESLILAQNQ